MMSSVIGEWPHRFSFVSFVDQNSTRNTSFLSPPLTVGNMESPSHCDNARDVENSVDISVIMPRPHPAHARTNGLVSQVQIFGLAEELKSCNCDKLSV